MKQHILTLAAVTTLLSPAIAQQSADPAIGLRLPTQKGAYLLGANLGPPTLPLAIPTAITDWKAATTLT